MYLQFQQLHLASSGVSLSPHAQGVQTEVPHHKSDHWCHRHFCPAVIIARAPPTYLFQEVKIRDTVDCDTPKR